MTSETPSPEPEHPEEEQPAKSKLTETLDTIKKSDKIETLYSFAKSNTLDTAAYVGLILAIVWLFFSPFYAGLLVGVIFGLYFSKEIADLVKNSNDFIDTQGMVRSLILGGTLLALFISAPGIFIGAAVVVGLKQLFLASEPPSSNPSPEQRDEGEGNS